MPKNLCHHTKDVLIQFINIFFAIHFGLFFIPFTCDCVSITLSLSNEYSLLPKLSKVAVICHSLIPRFFLSLTTGVSISKWIYNANDTNSIWTWRTHTQTSFSSLAHFLRSIVDNRQINRANDFCGVIRKSLPLFSLPLSLWMKCIVEGKECQAKQSVMNYVFIFGICVSVCVLFYCSRIQFE